MFQEARETLKRWIITLGDKSAQENIYYSVISLQEEKSAQLGDLE
jgi:hypothetical protein